MMMLVSLGQGLTVSISVEVSAYISHGSILIDGDDDFTAANGVLGGSGTSVDPYMIEGWSIATNESGIALSVVNTRSHFIVAQCEITYSDLAAYAGFASGIRLVNVTDAKIQNVTFEGYLLHAGLEADTVQNLTVEECSFASYMGINLRDCGSSATISKNTFDGCGVYVDRSHGNIIIDDNIIEGTLWIHESSDVNVSDNRVSEGEGVEILYSTNTTARGNTLSNCTIDVQGDRLEHFITFEISDTNSVNGLPVLFMKNQRGITLDCTGYGQVICANVSDAVIRGFVGPVFPGGASTLERGTDVSLGFCEDTQVTDCEFSNRLAGVRALGCSGITVSDSQFVNVVEGVLLGLCSECVVADNEFTGIPATGVNLGTSDHILVNNNGFSGEGEGVYIFNTSNSIVFENIFTTESRSIRLEEARDALIYHNDFMSGSRPIEINLGCVNLSFDNGYPEGGNYWGAVTLEDADKDGIGDDPIVIGSSQDTDEIFQDRYPLMQPLNTEVKNDQLYLVVIICASIGLTAGIAGIFILRHRRPRNPN
jgi:parallel beta-helix repeat protein